MQDNSSWRELTSIKSEGDVLNIVFPKSVKQNNATEVSEYVFDNLPEHFTKIRIDMRNLIFITADGLDIILELKKICRDITLLNVSLGICEILASYGFDNFLVIERYYRFVSIKELEKIGVGVHSNVYQLNDDTIIKVFTDDTPIEDIEKERRYAKDAFMKGVPSPIAFDIVKTEEGYGLILEMAGAQTLGEYLLVHPDEIDDMAVKFADVLRLVNETPADKHLYGSIKEEYRLKAIAAEKKIGKSGSEKLLNMIEAIPEGDGMIHGDFHLRNVMIDNNKKLMLIDMANTSYGHQLYDIGGAYLIMKYAPMKAPAISTRINKISPLQCERFWDIALRRYFNTKNEKEFMLRTKQCQVFSDIRLATSLGFTSANRTFLVNVILWFHTKFRILPKTDEYIKILSNLQ